MKCSFASCEYEARYVLIPNELGFCREHLRLAAKAFFQLNETAQALGELVASVIPSSPPMPSASAQTTEEPRKSRRKGVRIREVTEENVAKAVQMILEHFAEGRTELHDPFTLGYRYGFSSRIVKAALKKLEAEGKITYDPLAGWRLKVPLMGPASTSGNTSPSEGRATSAEETVNSGSEDSA
ncbi:MAG: hypothetical protein QXW56_09195 [Nitrososphaerota archaeon]